MRVCFLCSFYHDRLRENPTLSACTTLITFDDIQQQLNPSGIIPNGYKNLNWIHAEYVSISTFSAMSGYPSGVRSQPYVLHNPTSNNITITTANGARFSFDSLYLTSAWRDYLNVTMKTIRAGSGTSIGTYTVMTSSPIYVWCNFCTNIDTMTLETKDGIPHANYTQNGTELIIDDLCISFKH